jgi:hypothetical protein
MRHERMRGCRLSGCLLPGMMLRVARPVHGIIEYGQRRGASYWRQHVAHDA